MKHLLFSSALALLLMPVAALGLSNLPQNTATATVFISNYDEDGNFIGWGSGFFVDEGIIVTNKHVIESGDWYRVYATTANEKVNMECYKKITRSDVKINLDDDVAYMRVYLDCDHGIMNFAEDPIKGDQISVLGYPYKGSVASSTGLTVTTGTVNGATEAGWLLTNAHMDVGSSGGPVVNGTAVVGVTVAKGVDAQGQYVTGYFIPASIILEGLLYANDPRFGYTARSLASTSRISSSRSSSVSSSSSSRSSVSSRSSASSVRSSASSRHSSRGSSAEQVFPDVSRTMEGYEAIVSLYERGVIGGYPDGTFRPEGNINRAEFVKILVGGFREDELKGEEDCFSDVHDEWFAQYVCAAERLGWIDGYGDGTFRPEQTINRAEAMKIVVEAFGGDTSSNEDTPSDVRSGTWFYPYVAAGVEIGIVDPDEFFRPALNLIREDSAIWIDGARR